MINIGNGELIDKNNFFDNGDDDDYSCRLSSDWTVEARFLPSLVFNFFTVFPVLRVFLKITIILSTYFSEYGPKKKKKRKA